MTTKCVLVGCNTDHKKGKRKREKELEVPRTIPISSEKKMQHFIFPKSMKN